MTRRGSGILLHLTSLPSHYGIGDLGPWAYQFADFLAESKQSYWQILPLNPTSTALGNSPYSSNSAFAGNPLLISPDLLHEEGMLSKHELHDLPAFAHQRVDYDTVTECKKKLLRTAYDRLKSSLETDPEFVRFVRDHREWLDDHALFTALKAHFQGAPWHQWPKESRDRDPDTLHTWREQLSDQIRQEQFQQYLFMKQWNRLKRYCNDRGIQIIGDVPIYVQHDSADVWSRPTLFRLDDEKRPTVVAGVPPDYFSATGQLWGNPVYDWDALNATGYDWWVRRIAGNLELYNLIRLDHFRGFVAYWEVPAGHSTARQGRWVAAPVDDFLQTLVNRFPGLPIIAEDLGVITPDVREVMRRFQLPGMKILLFAFGEDLPVHPYAPHNYDTHCVVYTGTHDNNTIRGWIRKEISPEELTRLFGYLGREVGEHALHWELIRLAMMSVADTAIIPMQDLLGLGEEARMNRPSTTQGNWEWRFLPRQLTRTVMTKLSTMTHLYGRS